MNFPIKIVNMIENMYTDTRIQLNLGNLQTGWIRMEKRVGQGCILPPLFLNLCMEELIVRIRRARLGQKLEIIKPFIVCR